MLLITLLTLSLATAHSVQSLTCTPAPGLPRRANFSLYVLSMQWPFSVCATTQAASEACRSPPAAFIVRGLWPTSDTPGGSPTCCGATFSLAPILDIAPALARFWPDLSPANDTVAMWSRQWLLHGSCSGLAMRTYFRRVLDLSRRYDFLRALNAVGVVAATKTAHEFQLLQKGVNEATGGYHVQMRCRHAGKHILLDAIQVCLHKTRLETVHCPTVCLDGDVRCCKEDDEIHIPYWRHSRGGDGVQWTGDNPSKGQSGPMWIGQIAGILVLAAGLAFWMFKQFWERDDGRPNRSQYQRLW